MRFLEEMAEEIFLDKSTVTVTKSRLITPGETYAMSGIISVKTNAEKEKVFLNLIEKIFAIIFGWISGTILSIFVSAVFQGSAGDVLSGLIFILLFPLSWLVIKTKSVITKYSISLRTSSGELKALEGLDMNFMQEVARAINKAIIARG